MNDDTCGITLGKVISDSKYEFSIQELQLSGLNLGNESASCLAASFLKLKNLRAIDLSNNQVGDSGAASFVKSLLFKLQLFNHSKSNKAKFLFVNSTLKQLDLSFNMVGESGLRALRTAMRTNVSLTELNLNHNKAEIDQPLLKDINRNYIYPLIGALERNQRYDITIDHRYIDKHDIYLLFGSGFEPLQKLKHLNLTNCSLNDGTVSILVENILNLLSTLESKASLEGMDLSSNGITDAGAKELAKLLPVLKSLTLAENRITDVGLSYFSLSLPCSTIEHLDLSYNRIGNTSHHL